MNVQTNEQQQKAKILFPIDGGRLTSFNRTIAQSNWLGISVRENQLRYRLPSICLLLDFIICYGSCGTEGRRKKVGRFIGDGTQVHNNITWNTISWNEREKSLDWENG